MPYVALHADTTAGRTIVAGGFRPRTRAVRAREKVLDLFDRLGVIPDLDQILGGATTTTVVRARLISLDAVTTAVTRTQEVVSGSPSAEGPLWARARTAAQAARMGPVARGVRSLKTLAEAAGSQWQVEGAYLPGQEAMWVSWDDWGSEQQFIRRIEEGVCGVNPSAYAELGGVPAPDGEALRAGDWSATLL